MKRHIYQIAALAGAVLVLAGCAKQPGWKSGTEVRFGAGTKAESLTKTSYGVFVGESPNKKQMIDWVSGDVIRVVCDQASTVEEGTKKEADYKTTGGTRHESTAESRATLSLAGNNDKGLRWGSESEAHVFFAVYPSPYVKQNGTSLTTAGAFVGFIPEEQQSSVSGTTPSYVAAPDMTNQYMLAKRTITAGTQQIGESEVFLNFTPITTAIEFEVKNGMSEDLAINNIEIISASKNLSGKFTTSLAGLDENGGTSPTVTGTSGTLKQSAKVAFGTAGCTLAPSEILTLTVFLLPESDLADLTFRINKKGAGAGYIQTALKSDASTWLSFARCKKHFVKGLLANEGAKWTLCFDPEVDPWDDNTINKELEDPALDGDPALIHWVPGEVSDIDMEESANFEFASSQEVTTFTEEPGTGSSKTITITSTKEGESQAWPWTILSVEGNPATGGDGKEYITEELEVKNIDGKLVIVDKRGQINKGAHNYWTGHGDWSPASWNGKGAIDLSNNDVLRNDNGPVSSSMRTANCYIIRHAGTYWIPLVYGNAIDEVVAASTSGTNSSAYDGMTGENKLKPFVDCNGKGIASPFIENHMTTGGVITGKQRNNALDIDGAVVLWQENAGVVTIGTDPIKGDKLQKNAEPYLYTKSTVRYIEFTVQPDNICQTNAIICAY